jgi:hypothetical protein
VLHGLEHGDRGFGALGPEACALEQQLQRKPDVGLVVGDQDPRGRLELVSGHGSTHVTRTRKVRANRAAGR